MLEEVERVRACIKCVFTNTYSLGNEEEEVEFLCAVEDVTG